MGYVLASLVWGIAGFAAGYVLGRLTKEVHQIKEAVVPDETPADDDTDTEAAEAKAVPPPNPARRANRIGWIVILLAVVFVAQGVYQQVQLREQQIRADEQETAAREAQARREAATLCIGQWAVGFGEAFDARTKRSETNSAARYDYDKAAAATFRAMKAVLVPGQSDQDTRAALDRLRRAARQVDQAWAAQSKVARQQAGIVAEHAYPESPARCVQ